MFSQNWEIRQSSSGENRGAKIAQPETNLYKAGIWFNMFLHIYILLKQNPPAKALEEFL